MADARGCVIVMPRSWNIADLPSPRLSRRGRGRRDRAGAVFSLELLLVLPILLTVCLGIVELCMLLMGMQRVQAASNAACRVATLPANDLEGPADFRGAPIPGVLANGDHAAIRRWRRQQALAKTLRNRPDLLAQAPLTDDDREFLATLAP